MHGDPIAIKNPIGMPKAVVNDQLNASSSLAAEQGVRITEPATNPITPGRVNQSQQTQNSEGFHAGVDQMRQLARVFGMNIKASLQGGEGIDPMAGNHVIGAVTKDIVQDDGSVQSVYISRGQVLNFAC